MENRPVGRKKNVGTGGSGVHKRGEGLGTGPVLNSGAGSTTVGSSSGGPQGPNRSSGRGGFLFAIIIILFLLFGGGGGLSSLLSDDESANDTSTLQQDTAATQTQTQTQPQATTSSTTVTEDTAGSSIDILGALLGGYGSYQGASSGANAAWSSEANTGKLDTSVADIARDKRTVIKGGGKDVVTIMVYMCGADLESKSGMATRDIQEMLGANLGDNINLLIYTGGAKTWQNNIVSSATNQIYQVKNGRLTLLKDNLGKEPMTKAGTLSGFISWAAGNFPANRNILIFWNHGGGSTGGYGYDEKFPSAGSMSLAGINAALRDGGVDFDFVGFDTCLMATVENALVVSGYADYLVASEETEPGVGWYYTDWLTALGKNTSMETIQIGKNIIDSFTQACAQTCPGQKTTLSLIDLCELTETVPSELADFSKDTSEKINSEYKTVSDARSSTREFAASSRIDQVDLVDFANRMGTSESKELADALLGAIKYNRTSSNMTNAYGLSIYFPYQKVSKVDSMVDTYEDIGMDEDYAKCIQSFASMEVAGQVAAGGGSSASPMASLFGESSSAGSTGSSAEIIGQLLTAFLSSDFKSVPGLSASNTSFLGKSLDVESAADYIASNTLDRAALTWTTNSDGDDVIILTKDQWKLVQDLELNIFYDDGEGYVDLGLDNVYDFDDNGNLKAQSDKTWIAIDGQIVGYKVIDIQGNSDSYAITGRVPCYINGDRANLILVFDSDNKDGYVAGATYDYIEGETETIAKNLTELQVGDKIDFVTDYYDYSRNFKDAYYLGETMTVDKDMDEMVIENLPVGEGDVLVTYRFTDIYGQNYWTNAITY